MLESKGVGLRSMPKRQVTITFAGVLLALFLASLDQTIVGTAMPRIISDLGGFTHYTWVTTAYIISSAVIIPVTGKLTDMYGRKFFFIAGLGIFIVASLMSGLSSTMTQIIVWRGVQGLGAGVVMANSFTVIGDLFPPGERGKYQGIMSANFGLSSVIGPLLGGFITDTISWHWVFFVNIPLGLVIIILFAFFFPNFRPDHLKHQVDYQGVVTFILASVTAMLALSWGGAEYPWVSVPIIGMFAFSAIMAVLFLIIESRAREPIIPLSLFRNRIVVTSEVIIFFTSFGMFGSIIFVPLFFQGVLGATATASGSFLTPMMLGMVAGSFISGQLLSRAGGHYRLLGTVGLGVMAVGMWLLSRMTAETSYGTAVLNTSLTGFGLGITMPLYTVAVQNAVSYKLLGTVTSSTAFVRPLGGAVGLAVFGSVLNNHLASEFIGGLSPSIKAIIPAQGLSALARNPQPLVSPDAQAQLKGIFEQAGPQGTALFQQLLQVLRHALDSALAEIFLIGLIATIVSLGVNFFLKEIPLRMEHQLEDTEEEERANGNQVR